MGLRLKFAAALLAAGVLAAAPASAEDSHAHHHHAVPAAGTGVPTRHDFRVPEVPLLAQDGSRVSASDAIPEGRPVVLAFVYTSCTAVCPLTSAALARFQSERAAFAARVAMVSLSIDPEHDTPERLRAYAKRFDAGAQWIHYTGSTRASVRMQKAFEAYYGDKGNHRPAVYVRGAKAKRWTRLDGYPTPEEIQKALDAA